MKRPYYKLWLHNIYNKHDNFFTDTEVIGFQDDRNDFNVSTIVPTSLLIFLNFPLSYYILLAYRYLSCRYTRVVLK